MVTILEHTVSIRESMVNYERIWYIYENQGEYMGNRVIIGETMVNT